MQKTTKQNVRGGEQGKSSKGKGWMSGSFFLLSLHLQVGRNREERFPRHVCSFPLGDVLDLDSPHSLPHLANDVTIN